MQKTAEEQVQKGMGQVRRQGGDTAAFVAEDVETGQVVALVGGTDFTNASYGQNNYARLPLPPGSSFKAYDYSSLLENTTNFGAGSVLYDSQGPLPGYPCTNKALPENGGNCLYDFSRTYPGPVTLRYAIGGSRNVPAVKAMLTVGVDKTIETAEKIMNTGSKNFYGYKCYTPGTTEFVKANETACFSSSAIGDGAYLKLDEHVHGYATLARNGSNINQSYILKIVDDGGKTLDEWKPSVGTQAIRPDAAYILGDMISDPNPSYFSAKPQRFNTKLGTWKFAIKTGTTNDAKDGLMMGFTSKYAAGVWVGYHDRTKAMSGSMENMTLPIWQGFMRAVHQDIPPKDIPKPTDLQTLPAFVITSHVGYGSIEPSPSTDLYPSWYQNKNAGANKNATIDVISNKLATECTPTLAKKDLNGANAASFSGDTFVTGQVNTDQKDDIHACTDERPGVSINVNNGTVTASISKGTHPLEGNTDKGAGRVNFIVNGQVVNTQNISEGVFSYQYNLGGTGNVSAQVVDSVLYDATSASESLPALVSVIRRGERRLTLTTTARPGRYQYSNNLAGYWFVILMLRVTPSLKLLYPLAQKCSARIPPVTHRLKLLSLTNLSPGIGSMHF